MSIAVPLAVRLRTNRQDRHVTRDVHDLTFRSESPGGFASCTVSLNRPLTLQPDEIATYGRLYVYDGRNGSTVWEGRLDDQGRTAGSDGEVWELVAVGPSAHTRDREVPLIYADRSLDWPKSRYSSKGGEVEQSELDDDTPSLVLRFPDGAHLTTSSTVDAIYRKIQQTGQKIGRVRVDWIGGLNSSGSNFSIGIYTRTDAGASSGAAGSSGTNVTTTGGSIAVAVGDSNFSNGDNVVSLRLNRNNSSATTADDTVWVAFTNVTVAAMRYNADGSEITSYSSVSVKAHQVVNDLLGRLLTSYDGANASVATTTHDIDQLTYPDGINAGDLLDDLMEIETAYTWHAWESNSSDDYRFEWVAWPSEVRYEADVVDGFDSPGSGEGIYNAVRVRWTTEAGKPRTTRRTSTVAALTDAVGGALIREAIIDLGDDVGSSTNAARAGDEFLADHSAPPNAGTLTISRPINDLVSGRRVWPWEIRPGSLIRVRGVLPRLDSLNATARDGVTVFRIVGAEYNQGSNSAALELDSYPVSVARAIAAGARRRARRR